jgi:hypothetical protein
VAAARLRAAAYYNDYRYARRPVESVGFRRTFRIAFGRINSGSLFSNPRTGQLLARFQF